MNDPTQLVGWPDLAIAALLVVALAGFSWLQNLQLGSRVLIASTRTVVQLSLIGLVLQTLFAQTHPGWVALMGSIMLLIAGREASARQKRRLRGIWGYGVGLVSMFLSSVAITVLALIVIVRADPWHTPQIAIPLLGMMLGNTMNGVALGLSRITEEAWRRRAEIEARLCLGMDWRAAILPMRREAVRSAMIPILNTLSAAGLVTLPGMMTGQILGGADPMTAVRYQILIMFMIAAGVGFGAFAAVGLGARRLFDNRSRLRLERLHAPK
ncbi:ABC transporter permease [Magnetofaba australis]|uniref:Putative ybbM family protein n=1 Tax=Magnetofaba australis IT-1 TaxID=1434232 RepID=A0A1Y2K4N6_9PROT|nr:iron export ABC transporter permease subunit FetB [Magnetofaba australis]OSM04358.1 putative ybbM family protein [Magnetofaba australis IT-1]